VPVGVATGLFPLACLRVVRSAADRREWALRGRELRGAGASPPAMRHMVTAYVAATGLFIAGS
jgi:hypothetical protein